MHRNDVGVAVYAKLVQFRKDIDVLIEKNHAGFIDDARELSLKLKHDLKYDHTEALKFCKAHAKLAKTDAGGEVLTMVAILAKAASEVTAKMDKKDGLKHGHLALSQAMSNFAPANVAA